MTARPDLASFRWVWLGQSVSLFGNETSTVTWQLLAVVTLSASAPEVGLLTAAATASSMALPILLGPVIDRANPLRTMLLADISRGVVVFVVLALLLSDSLTLVSLAASLAVLGGIGSCFDTAYFSVTPMLVPKDYLPTANARFQSSKTLAETSGPGLGGVLFQALGAVGGLTLDLVTFVISAITLRHTYFRELPMGRIDVDPSPPGTPYLRQASEGLRFLLHNPPIRLVSIATFFFNFAAASTMAVVAIMGLRELGLNPAQYGLVLAVASSAGFVVSLFAGRVARADTLSVTMPLGMGASALGLAGVSLVPERGWPAIVLFSAADALSVAGVVIFMVCNATFRQLMIPRAIMGRTFAATRLFVRGALPLGAVVGGLVAQAVGVRATFALSGGLQLLASLYLALRLHHAIHRSAAAKTYQGALLGDKTKGEVQP